MKVEWLYCPVCGNKTRNKIRDDTILKNYPLYCPKCKQETLVDVKNMEVKKVNLTRIQRVHVDFLSKIAYNLT